MRHEFSKLSVFVCLAVAWFSSSAWAQLPMSTLNGIVTDPQGAVLPSARVVLISQATGVRRETTTGGQGRYVFSNVPAGLYTVRVEASGFAVQEFKDIRLEVGRTTTLDMRLEVAALGAEVTVTGGAAGVELTQSQVQGQISSDTVENIPLNGRNFLELAFLVPGNRPATNYDPTKTNTLEVSSAGSFGRGGNISVDGGDNNDEVVGGTLMNLPQDAVQEFQIATNRYTAEVGRSGSSIINIITKSGSNELHGSAFIFLRDAEIQGRAATLDPDAKKPPFDRQQIGFSVGGPVKPDHAWWFFSLENRNQDAAVEVGERDLTAQRVVTGAASAPLDDFLLTARADFKATDQDNMYFRYAFNRSEEVANGSLALPLGSAANRQSSFNRFNSFLYNWTRTVSPTKVNTLIFHMNFFLNKIPEFGDNLPETNPDLGLTNELRFPTLQDGANFRIPQRTRFRRFQLRDTFGWKKGSHSITFGGDWQNQQSDALFDLFGSGTIVLTENFANQDRNGDGMVNDLDIPIAASIRSAAPVRPPFVPDIDNTALAFFVQDDWRVRPNLTFNIGLRWEFDTDIFGEGPAHQACPEPLSVQPDEPCVWLRGVLGLNRARGLDNFGPRLGFAWDPFRSGKTVVRGGYGIYYNRVVLEVRLLELLLDGRILALDVVGGSTIDPATGMFLPDPDTGQIVNLDNPFAGPAAAIPLGINVIDNDAAHPYTQQWTLGIEQEVVPNWIVSVDGIHNFAQRQLVGRLLRDANNNPITVTDPLTGRSDNIVNIEPSGKAWYDGLLVSVQKKYTTHGRFGYSFQANYTLSKSFSFANDDQIPFNVFNQADVILGINNFELEKGFAPTDERHRLVFFGTFDFPYDFSISPIWTLASDVPIDPVVPELGGPRLPIASRNALGRSIGDGAELNDLIQEWNSTFGQLSQFPTLPLVDPSLNFGDSLNSFDLRLTKGFVFAERHRAEFIAEVFNLFNVTNIRGFNNTNFSGFNNAISDVGFNQPLRTAGGFFGAGGPRAFQFALRYSF